VPNSSGNTGFADKRAAYSDALSGDSVSIDTDLAELIAVWPALPEATRKSILATARAVAK
jgi:hypothetical protein